MIPCDYKEVCEKNKKHKANSYVTNFGQFNSLIHGICSFDGDCLISICVDFQDSVEMIPFLFMSGKRTIRLLVA